MLKTLKLPLVALALLALVAIPALAKPVADIQVTTAGISADPAIEYSRAMLTVTGKRGFSASKAFAPGEAIDLNFDGALADGKYSYELVFAPVLDEGTRASFAAAREAGKLVDLGIQAKAQSGSFTVKNGALVDASLVEEVRAKDIVHNDDVIALFSMCIGTDCTNGMNFGFDTLVLKENNLRMFFDDTSNSASFPKNDWRLVANGTNNGDDSYFVIQDATAGRDVFRVDAGAPANSLRVNSSGNVGIGESNPVVELHVQDGDSPTLRLEQDGSSGFDPQTFDIVSNEANFFIRDVTNGSQLPFRIKPGADTDALFIAANNDIGIGTDTPDASVHVQRSGTSVVSLQMTQLSGVSWSTRVTGGGQYRITDTDASGTDDGVNEFNLDGDGNLSITGTITTGGMTCGGGCDLVFSPDYELESIEEHAASMWKNSYLPQVGPTVENQPLDLTDKTGRMLNELEKAHIYIEQLNNTVKQLEQRLAELEAKNAEK